jgi:outer membrane murein-binding lipoprotein Lpp
MKIKSFLIASVLSVAILGFGFVASAQTTDVSALIAQLQAQIQSLMQQIQQLQTHFLL